MPEIVLRDQIEIDALCDGKTRQVIVAERIVHCCGLLQTCVPGEKGEFVEATHRQIEKLFPINGDENAQ